MNIARVEITDFCVIHIAHLDLEARGLVLITGENNDTAAADSNGAGKSTLFKGITWCLYDQCIDGDRADKIIRRGADFAKVITILRDGTVNWRVKRERKRGSGSKLSMTLGDGKLTLKGEAAQAKIYELLGLDFHAFKNTVLYGQNDSSRFADIRTTDKQRKDMLHKILRTEILQKCEAWARLKVRDMAKQIEEIHADAAEVAARMDEYDLDGLDVKMMAWNEDHTFRLSGKRKRLGDKAALHKAYRSDVKSIPGAKKLLAEAQEKLDEYEDVEDRLEVLEKDINDAKATSERAATDHSTANAQRTRALVALEVFSGDKCPVCNSDLSEGTPAEYKAELEGHLEDFSGKCDALSVTYNEIQETIAALEGKRAEHKTEAKEHRALVGHMTALKAKVATLEWAEERATELKAEIEELMAEIKKADAEPNPHEETLLEAVKRTKELTKELKKLEKQAEMLEKDRAHYQFWVKGFSGQGLPSFVMEGALPYITERANHYLKVLADGDIQVNFDALSELTTGEIRDKINISWTIEGEEDTTPSGGQRKKIEIAADLALMDLVATREGSNVNLLLMDEILDGLDREGQDRVLKLLQELRGARSSIFVITHEPGISEMFEHNVEVVKKDRRSSLRFRA